DECGGLFNGLGNDAIAGLCEDLEVRQEVILADGRVVNGVVAILVQNAVVVPVVDPGAGIMAPGNRTSSDKEMVNMV
ncbi:MAG: hypothetical protein IIU49_00700, partial [Spirochaetales bacterium]|nr:hypothetical protein [Spirochaetales bacterium]